MPLRGTALPAVSLAVVLLVFAASCSRQELTGTRSRVPITFGVRGIRGTLPSRAVVESDAATLENGGFNVAAMVSGTSALFFSDIARYSGEGLYETESVHYFPYGQTLDIFAVSPPSFDVSLAGGQAVVEYVQDGSTDLIASEMYGMDAEHTPVALTFKHILSQMSIFCKGIDPTVDYELTSVVVSSPESGNYSFLSGQWEAGTLKGRELLCEPSAVPSDSPSAAGETATYLPGMVNVAVSWNCLKDGVTVGSYEGGIVVELSEGVRHSIVLNLPANGLDRIVWSIAVNEWTDTFTQYMAGKAASMRIDNASGTVSLPPITLSAGCDLVIDWGDGKMEKISGGTVTPSHDYTVSGAVVVTFYISDGSASAELGYLYRHSGIPFTVYDSNRFSVNYTRIPEPVSLMSEGDAEIAFMNNLEEPPLLQYSYDGETWTDWDLDYIRFGNGIPLYLRGEGNERLSGCDEDSFFNIVGENIIMGGDIMSLLDWSDINVKLSPYCFYFLFYECDAIVAAPELPATELEEGCYSNMFNCCVSLVKAPELPATVLADECYMSMFFGCSSLTESPELPALTLADYCYTDMFNSSGLVLPPELPATSLAPYCYQCMFGNTPIEKSPELPATVAVSYCYNKMFYGCSSLREAPELPATQLGSCCYQYMFYGCSSLASAPELPATTLANSCYSSMFKGCRQLKAAPVLPAKTLVKSCYQSMFDSCPSLSSIKAMFTTTPSDTYTKGWVKGVASNGTFTKNASATWNVTGTNGIPSGWSVVTE